MAVATYRYPSNFATMPQGLQVAKKEIPWKICGILTLKLPEAGDCSGVAPRMLRV